MSAFISGGHIHVFNSVNNEFEIIPFNGEILSASFQYNRICIIDSNNNLWVYGSNSLGLLGLPNVYQVNEFTNIPLNFRVRKVVCAGSCTVIIDETGNIWYTGTLGRLQSQTFTQFTDNFHFMDVSCGNRNILAIDTEGNLWGYGDNYTGCLGVKARYLEQFTMVRENAGFVTVSCSNGGSVCVDLNGQAWACGIDIYHISGWDVEHLDPWEFNIVARNIRVKDAICGNNILYLLAEDGRVFRCGISLFGQRGDIVRQHQGIGRYEEIAQGITQINYENNSGRLMLKDQDNNILIAGRYEGHIFPFQMLDNMTADTLVDQKSFELPNRRSMTTKSARKYVR